MVSEPVKEPDAAHAIVNKALSRVGDIATLPAVTVKIIELVEDPKSTARDLHEVIKTDPALSTKVLKVVNSAFYGLPGQIANVDRAIVLLGLSAVKNIAIASSIARLFKGERITEQFSAADLWKHSVAVGVCSRSLARAMGNKPEAEEVFLAGLIHDLGILIERQAFGDELGNVIVRAAAGEDTYLECERQVFGADHQIFGAALAAKWKFPRHLRAVIGYHHDASRVAAEMQSVVALVQIADIICCRRKIGFYLSAAGQEVSPALLAAAHLSEEHIEIAVETLEEDCATAEAVLMT